MNQQTPRRPRIDSLQAAALACAIASALLAMGGPARAQGAPARSRAVVAVG